VTEWGCETKDQQEGPDEDGVLDSFKSML
jgi:hypothetical protein